MDASRQIRTLERSDIKRHSVEISNVADHRAKTVSGEGNPGQRFSEVAAEILADPRGDKSIFSEIRPPKSEETFKLWEKSKVSFGDLVDIINPLQHIPVVATIYRNKTGDGIGMVSRVVGGALWGRVGGFVSGIANAVVDRLTGKDIGDHIYTAFFGDSERVRSRTGTAELPSQAPTNQATMAQAVSQASKTMESAFGDFDDDGGFSGIRRASKLTVSLASRSTANFDSLAALNSYEQNIDLDESKEPFRFRFPA